MKKYRVLFEMKSELKALVKQIKEDKKPPRCQHSKAMFEYRHLHIARCLIKGRAMEEIEGLECNRKSGNKRNETYLQRLMDKWLPLHMAEMKEWAEKELVPVLAKART